MTKLLLKIIKISNLTAQQQEAQKQVDQIQEQVSAIQTEQSNLQSENDRLQAESKKLEGEITELLRILYLVMIRCKNKLVVLKQMELQQVT